MPISPKPRVLVVINPISGGQPKDEIAATIQNYAREHSWTVEMYELTGDDNESLNHWIHNWKPEMVVAVGGDGTLKCISSLLANTGMVVGLIPAGSANGMANELGFPKDIDGCLDVLTNGEVKTIDMVEINGQLSIHLSDVGMNAELIKYFEESDQRGKWGYAREVWRVLANKSQLKAMLTIDNNTIKREAFMIVIANASKYGNGAIINPKGDISDGRFEVVVLKKLSVWEILKIMLNISKFDRSTAEIFQAKDLKITLKRPAHFQVDGEYLDKTSSITATIHPGILHIMLPKPVPEAQP